MRKVAIVTGASRGIGVAVARELAGMGYALGMTARTADALLDAVEVVKKESPGTEVVTGIFDISDDASISTFVGEVHSRLGDVSVLVNNAGQLVRGTSGVSADELRRMLDVNLVAATVFSQAVIPDMKKAKAGHIINVSSICGVEAYPDVGAYCASKFGLVGYSSALDQELAPHGITVTALCPSWVDTRMASHSPLKKEEMISPSDLAVTVRYLLSLSNRAHVREIVIHC